jgi:hypothetical protein
VAAIGDLTGFNTEGGEEVTLTGDNFGPLGTPVEAFYRVPQNDIGGKNATLQGSLFQAVGCVLTTPHTEVVCTSAPGVGSGHVWLLRASNQVGEAPASATTRYASPSFISMSRTDGGALSELDTRGGANVTLVGANFGPVASNNVVEVTYQIPGLNTVQLAALGLAGNEFKGRSCSVVVPHVQILCTTSEGVGGGHSWNVAVGKQDQDAATSAMTASTLTSSYSRVTLTQWSSPATAAALDTRGGQVLTAIGDFFGPVGTNNLATATYENGALSGFGAGPFLAVPCNVTVAHTEMQCTTVQGVGHSHYWNFTVGAQGMVEGTGETILTTSYRPPALRQVTADTASKLFSTAGGEFALLSGFNFGPPLSSAPSNTASATYGNPLLADAGFALMGDTYAAVDCEVMSFTEARCKTVEGLGYSQRWTFTVGGQTWPSAGLNLTFVGEAVNASRVETSYHPPEVTNLKGPGGAVSSEDGWSHVLLLAAGGEKVVLNGTNFGPAGFLNTFRVTYANRRLEGLAGSRYTPSSCFVSTAHSQITCVSAAGVGSNHSWALTVGNQTAIAAGAATLTSYLAPQVKYLGT